VILLLAYPIGGTLVNTTPRYSINVTLDGCCDHREMVADEEWHRHAAENLGAAGGHPFSFRNEQLARYTTVPLMPQR